MKSSPEFGVRARNYFPYGGSLMYSVEGMMTIPIAPWSAKGFKSEGKSMGLEIEAMEQDKQSMFNMANQNVTMLLIKMNSANKELDNYTRFVIPAYKKSLDANILSYKQNTNDLFMTLLAYDDLQMTELDYLMQLSSYLNIQAEYEKEVQIR